LIQLRQHTKKKKTQSPPHTEVNEGVSKLFHSHLGNVPVGHLTERYPVNECKMR